MTAQPYRPAFRPDTLKGPATGVANDVIVLGTPHLSGLPDSFRPELLRPLIDRLARWRPTVIVNENMSGLLCQSLRQQGQRQADVVETFCYDPSAAGKAIGLDVQSANAETERLLSTWPASPSPAQRRRLAVLFLAAGEPTSAMVQWLRLALSERRASDEMNASLAAELTERIAHKDEDNLLVAALAAQMGLERVWGVDDQSSNAAPVDEDAYGKAMAAAWDNAASKARAAKAAALYQGIVQPQGLLALYRAFNAPAFAISAFRSDWGAALDEPSAASYGRRYVAYWEARNLRMVANIREVLGRSSGARLLAIVGASHKGYYEAYLNQMHDVRLDNVEAVLR